MTPLPPRKLEPEESQALHDAVHALAQPLTALTFLLELGLLQADPPTWHDTLKEARTECLRAVKALEQVRAACQSLEPPGDPR